MTGSHEHGQRPGSHACDHDTIIDAHLRDHSEMADAHLAKLRALMDRHRAEHHDMKPWVRGIWPSAASSPSRCCRITASWPSGIWPRWAHSGRVIRANGYII